MKKRGQLTLIIILAIVIVAVVLVVIFMTTQRPKPVEVLTPTEQYQAEISSKIQRRIH